MASKQDDAELEAAFQALRLSSLEEALASLNQEPHSDVTSSDSGCSSNSASSSSSSSSPPTSPTFSNSDSSYTTSSIVPRDQNGPASTNGTSPKRTRRVLSQLDVNELIQMKISQLESAPLTEDDDEKAIGMLYFVVFGQEMDRMLLSLVIFLSRQYTMSREDREQKKEKK